MTVAPQVRLELRHYPYHAPLIATRQRFSLRRKGRIPVHSIGSNGGRRLAWSRGFTPPRGYQSPVMDGDPGALVTPRRSGPEVVGSNPTGPTMVTMNFVAPRCPASFYMFDDVVYEGSCE